MKNSILDLFITHSKSSDDFCVSKRLDECIDNLALNEAAQMCYFVDENGKFRMTDHYKFLCAFMEDKEFEMITDYSSSRAIAGHELQNDIVVRLKSLNLWTLSLTENRDDYVLFLKLIRFARFSVRVYCTYDEFKAYLSYSYQDKNGGKDLIDLF